MKDQVFVTLDLNMRPMTLTHSVRKKLSQKWIKWQAESRRNLT